MQRYSLILNLLLLCIANDSYASSPISFTKEACKLVLHKVGLLKNDRWELDGPFDELGAQRSYNQEFSSLFNMLGYKGDSSFFENWLDKRKQLGLSANILDIMGSGFFAPKDKVDSITGIRLMPVVLTLPEILRGKSTPKQIYGDINSPKIWEELDTSMARRGIKSMDLITLVPIGGG